MGTVQRGLTALFFIGLVSTGILALEERSARGLWQQARNLQGQPSYDPDRSDQLYESVDLWHTRRTTSTRILGGLGLALAMSVYLERRRRATRA